MSEKFTERRRFGYIEVGGSFILKSILEKQDIKFFGLIPSEHQSEMISDFIEHEG
jgi:hypothetical protein